MREDDVFLFPEKGCAVCGAVNSQAHSENCSNQNVYAPKRQLNLLQELKPLHALYPQGFIIIVAPANTVGSVFQVYKSNARNLELLNRVEMFVKEISGWNTGNQN